MYSDFLWQRSAADAKDTPTKLRYVALTLKSSLLKLYGHHHDLVWPYEIFIYQMTMEVFHFFFLYHRQDFHLTWRYIWVTRRVSYMEQELLTFREQLSLPPVLMRYVLLIFSVFCVVFVCLRRIYVCPILPVSLDCPFLIAPVVFSNVYLFVCLRRIYVLCARSCQCLWIVHSWLPLLFSLTFILHEMTEKVVTNGQILRHIIPSYSLWNMVYNDDQ